MERKLLPGASISLPLAAPFFQKKNCFQSLPAQPVWSEFSLSLVYHPLPAFRENTNQQCFSNPYKL